MIAQREMQEHLCVYQARAMQSAPFPNQRGTWQPGDFSLHFGNFQLGGIGTATFGAIILNALLNRTREQ